MDFEAVRSPWRVAGVTAVAVAALAGCGATSSATSPSAASSTASGPASSSAAASPSGTSGSGGGTASATSVVALAATSASTATSVNGTVNLQATVKAGATASPAASGASTTSGSSGDMSLSGTFTERLRPSVLASVNITSLTSGGTSVPGGVSEILTPSTLYFKAPALTQQLKLSKPWLSIPLSKLSQSTGVNLGQVLSSASSNGPLSQSQLLAGATSAKEVGTTTLDGVKVTEYTGTTDLSKAAASLTGSSQSALEQEIKKAGLSTATFTVWVDGQHVARKDVINENGKTIKETVTTTITSINQPVNITAPPASQTAPLPTGSSATES